ncbi:ParM/StbA family protein [Pseudomonas lactis]|uniref:ParM/StbA family protein n=1 Tax=Pseudomonas lactis TaxID=1615674 RepID=UPI003F7FB5C3
MNGFTAVGLDAGRSAVKAVAYSEGKRHEVMFPSIVVPAVELSDPTTAERARLETEEYAGKRYFTGDTARLQGNLTTSVGLSDNWTNTPEYLVLIKSAITRLKAVGVKGLDDAYIVIGTPSKLYSAHQATLVQRTRQVVSADATVKALPQPMGAYCDYILDSNGLPIIERIVDESGKKKSYGVIEGGHFSTDFLLMKEGQYIERAADSCAGMYAASEHLRRIMAKRNVNASLIECEEAFRTKKFYQYGEVFHADAETLEAASHVVTEILHKGNSLFGDDARLLHNMLIAGGSAPVIHPICAESWKHSLLLPNPRWAVADGFARYALGQLVKTSLQHKTVVAANV